MIRLVYRHLIGSILLIFLMGVTHAEGMAFPAFNFGDPQAKNKVEFFVSPTCIDCALTFKNSVLSLLNQAIRRKDLYVFVGIIPGSNSDLKFARVLSCVPQSELMPYMTEWFSSRRSGPAQLSSLLTMGKKYGILGSSEAECTNAQNDAAFVGFSRLVFTENNVKRVPAIFVDGSYVPEIFYRWQFEDLFPQLRRE